MESRPGLIANYNSQITLVVRATLGISRWDVGQRFALKSEMIDVISCEALPRRDQICLTGEAGKCNECCPCQQIISSVSGLDIISGCPPALFND